MCVRADTTRTGRTVVCTIHGYNIRIKFFIEKIMKFEEVGKVFKKKKLLIFWRNLGQL